MAQATTRNSPMTAPNLQHLSATRRILPVLLVLLALFVPLRQAEASKVLALVNDMPVTDYDVSQRLKLNSIIGGARDRKAAFRSVVNDAVLITEARKAGVDVSEVSVDKAIERMAKNMGGMAKLKATLRKKGVRMSTLKSYVRSSLLFRVMAQKLGKKINPKVDQAEIDRRYRKILKDPRLQPITIYNVRQVLLPVENVAPAMRQQLYYARLVEAQQIMQRYKGCRTLKQAASGIFNVKVSKILPADPRRMPKELRKALRTAGTKKMVGPIRTRQGIQMFAFCGTRKIAPPKPKKEQIAAMVRAEALSREMEKVMRELRKRAYIEYKDRKFVLN